MHDGEVSEVRCTPHFCGGELGADILVRAKLLRHSKLIICPDSDGSVEVRLHTDPEDARGVNEEATCRVRYVVRCKAAGGAGASGGYVDVAETEGGAPLGGGADGVLPFTFVQGCGQVLPCIDMAVRQMRPGGHAFVTSPSRYAYGAANYAPHGDVKAALVDTYRSRDVEVEIELVSVDRFKANYMMEVSEKVGTQAKRKEQGNALFKKSEYAAALLRWELAILPYTPFT